MTRSLPDQSLPDQSLPDRGPAVRRPRRPAAERRREILDAARTLFAERGYHATTTRDLAAAADINDALIYRYFPDKQAILAALVDEAVAIFGALPRPPDQAPLPLDQLLELIGTGFIHTIRANLDLVTILIGERYALDGDTRFVAFIDDAATRLGHLIDAEAGDQAGDQAGGTGLPDRARLLRCPDRLRAAAGPARHELHPAGRYRRVHSSPGSAHRAGDKARR